ncbi:hypothetical protein DFH06DRAFT_1123171 [Mycena polygramma]|nr:hypothetical protein DFH06DRAFT_1123171 [Mycena polygramma]
MLNLTAVVLRRKWCTVDAAEWELLRLRVPLGCIYEILPGVQILNAGVGMDVEPKGSLDSIMFCSAIFEGKLSAADTSRGSWGRETNAKLFMGQRFVVRHNLTRIPRFNLSMWQGTAPRHNPDVPLSPLSIPLNWDLGQDYRLRGTVAANPWRVISTAVSIRQL